MKTLIGSKTLINGLSAMCVASGASAAVVTSPFLETFDDPTTDVTFNYTDFNGNATGTGSGWSIAGGQADFLNVGDFGDVGTALVQINSVPPATDFAVSADFRVDQFDFSAGKAGVLSNGINPDNFNQDFSGLFAYVQELDFSGSRYQFVLANNQNVLATSSEFDLTDGTADFGILLEGSFQPSGDLDLTATLTDVGGQNDQLLSSVVLGTAIPGGNNYGVRINPQTNTLDLGVDNLSVVVPEPGTLALAGLAGAVTLLRRRVAD